MGKRPVITSEWTRYEIVGRVADDGWAMVEQNSTTD